MRGSQMHKTPLSRSVRISRPAPCFMLMTARGSWSERVEGIDAGADDYLPKPFQFEELTARVRALIADMDLAGRDEVEALKAIATAALDRVDALEARIAALEAGKSTES